MTMYSLRTHRCSEDSMIPSSGRGAVGLRSGGRGFAALLNPFLHLPEGRNRTIPRFFLTLSASQRGSTSEA